MKFLGSTSRFIGWTLIALICGFVLICSAIYLYLSPSLPPVEQLKSVQLQTPLRIYSSDNQLVAEFGEKRRSPLNFEQIPPYFVQALIAVEDKNFEKHFGIDFKGFSRAVLEFASTGERGGGGSTLTQQVAKNFFLTRDKTFKRKFREIVLAIQMEQILTKKEIFELYVNKNFFGHRAYGIQAAAQVYYGRDINDLTLPELAMIAGLPQRPSGANPISYPANALKRRNRVLSDMLKLDFISDITYQEAIRAPLTARSRASTRTFEAPWVAEMVREEMVNRYGENAYNDGYRVYTTVNSQLQQAANLAVQRGLINYTKRHGWRGAYRRLAFNTELDTHSNHLNWIKDIRQELIYGGLQLAVVVRADQDQLYLLDREGQPISIHKNSFEWARKHISESKLGPKLKSASEVAGPGDAVWIELLDGQWQLAQIPYAQGALIAMNPRNGAISSLVGGFDFKQNKYNRVIQAKRQPGSNIKPFFYAAALEKGYTAASILNDSPIVFEDDELETTWRPKNAGRYLGPIPLRQGLYQSRNVVSIRLLNAIGVNYARDYMTNFGFDANNLNQDLSLALGSSVMPPMKVMEAYSVFANGGYKVTPYLIQRIEDHSGNILYEAEPTTVCAQCLQQQRLLDQEAQLLASLEEDLDSDLPQETPLELLSDDTQGSPTQTQAAIKNPPKWAPQAIDPRTAFIMDSILKDVVKKGTGRRALVLGRKDLAGKTGTTNEGVDAWFSGYSPHMVASAWVGFDRPSSLGRGEWGGATALPIWIDFMKVALQGQPERSLPRPPGVINSKIDPVSGLLARPGQSDAVFEVFREEFAPTEVSQERVQVFIDEEPTEEELQRAVDGESPEETPDAVAPEMLF